MKTKMSKHSLTYSVFLLLAVISITTFNSCQQDFGIDPVYNDGSVTGVVIDKLTLQKLTNASILITRIEAEGEYNTTTNDTGYFSVSIPVIPIKKPFRIQVSKIGYQPVDTLIDCNCDNLDLQLIQLVKLTCGITWAPEKLRFADVTVGTSQSSILKIMNQFPLTVSITNIQFSKPVFSLDKSVSVPFDLQGLASKFLPIVFTPIVPGPDSGYVIISTNCPNNSQFIVPINGNALQAICGIEPDSISTGKNPKRIRLNYFTDSTYSFKVYNFSNVPLSYNYSVVPDSITSTLPNNPDLLTVTPGSPGVIPANSFITVKIKVANPIAGDFFAKLILTTGPGACGATVPLWVYYYQGGYESKILYRWSNSPGKSNPDGIFTAFRFSDSLVVYDSTGVCQGEGVFGAGNPVTSIRFDSIVTYGTDYFAVLKSSGGIQLLGNSFDELLPFTAGIWQVRVAPGGQWDNGCGNTLFREGDVIAVKYSPTDTKYGLIRIERIEVQKPEGYERINFSFIVVFTN